MAEKATTSAVLYLAREPKADALLSANPFALAVGMVLDQQVPMERAFSAPLELEQRLGKKLTAKTIAALDPAVLDELFTRTHALHRFPSAMATRVHQFASIVTTEWKGDASAVWTSAASGEELVKRLKSLPGFGDSKAKIFTALLGKQLGCAPKGWRQACSPYGDAGTLYSIADIKDSGTYTKVREHKRAMKAAHKAAAAKE
jgi:uncharacterized HhH-GPD family protein